MEIPSLDHDQQIKVKRGGRQNARRRA